MQCPHTIEQFKVAIQQEVAAPPHKIIRRVMGGICERIHQCTYATMALILVILFLRPSDIKKI